MNAVDLSTFIVAENAPVVIIAHFRLVKPHEFRKLKPEWCMSIPYLWFCQINLVNNVLIGAICDSLDFLSVASPALEHRI